MAASSLPTTAATSSAPRASSSSPTSSRAVATSASPVRPYSEDHEHWSSGPRTRSAISSRRAPISGAAHWASSTIIAIGRRVAMTATNWERAHAASSANVPCSPATERASAAATTGARSCSAMCRRTAAVSSSGERGSTPRPVDRRATRGSRGSSSPSGTQRAYQRSARSPQREAASSTRRVFPIPGGPARMTRRTEALSIALCS